MREKSKIDWKILHSFIDTHPLLHPLHLPCRKQYICTKLFHLFSSLLSFSTFFKSFSSFSLLPFYQFFFRLSYTYFSYYFVHVDISTFFFSSLLIFFCSYGFIIYLKSIFSPFEPSNISISFPKSKVKELNTTIVDLDEKLLFQEFRELRLKRKFLEKKNWNLLWSYCHTFSRVFIKGLLITEHNYR